MVNPRFSFGEVVKSMYALKERIGDVWEYEIDQISAAGKALLGHDSLIIPCIHPINDLICLQ